MEKFKLPKIPTTYLSVISWAIVALISFVTYRAQPFHSDLTGDEPYYLNEVRYLAQYGFYNSLCQGTSFAYTSMLYIFSRLVRAELDVTIKLFSAISFLLSCFVFLKVLGCFKKIDIETRFIAMLFYAYTFSGHMYLLLPNTTNALFVLLGILALLKLNNYKGIALGGFLFFFAFIIKPIALFYIPGILLFLFIDTRHDLMTRLKGCTLFFTVFITCFIIYHAPSYQRYGKLMLEDKNHTYEAGIRKEGSLPADQKSIYYEVYNPNKRTNIWLVTPEEVEEYREKHPEIKLQMSHTEFIKTHFKVWFTNSMEKIFLDIPFHVDLGIFYHKWTIVNKWIKNLSVIKLGSLLILLVCCYKEREFIVSNRFLVAPIIYLSFLSLYLITQLENGWLLSSIPFIALPILQYLQRKLSVYVVLLCQIIILFV